MPDTGSASSFPKPFQAKPNLTARGWTLLVVNYKDEADLIYNLAGVDLVISFISGDDQLLLIDAAQKIGVTKFVCVDCPMLKDTVNCYLGAFRIRWAAEPTT